MPSFALLDIVSPYVLGGDALGENLHELLSAIFVTEIETAFDDNGICISGIARFSADLNNLTPRYIPPATITWRPDLQVNHTTQRTAGAWWELPDIAIGFRLTAPRTSSPVADRVISGRAGGTPAPLSDAALAGLLAGLGQGTPPPGQLAADAPGTVFRMDILLDVATLHLPFLSGARLEADGMLAPDPQNPEVTITLPKIKLTLAQTAGIAGGAEPQMTLSLDSFAAADIDEPAGAGYAELLRMQPPYALLGPEAVLGFGFHSLIVDMSGTRTPPQLLEKFGLGDDFRGLYFPDVRVFVKTALFNGTDFDFSAREMVIALGPDGGISGVFGVDVVHPDRPVEMTLLIYDGNGALLHRLKIPAPDQPIPRLMVPGVSRWVLEVTGGQPPYNISIDAQQQTSLPVPVSFMPPQQTRSVRIDVMDVHTGSLTRRIEVPISLLAPSLSGPDGADQSQGQRAIPTVLRQAPAGYRIDMLDYPAQERVTLTVSPPGAVVEVTSGGLPLAADFPGGKATLPLAHNQTIEVTATWTTPAAAAHETRSLRAGFQYDQPTAQMKIDSDPAARQRFADDPKRVQTGVSPDEPNNEANFIAPSVPLISSAELADFIAFASAHPDAPITLRGQASIDNRNPKRNDKLSADRILVIETLLAGQLGATRSFAPLPEGEEPEGGAPGLPGRGWYRQVIASVSGTTATPAVTHVARLRITRPARGDRPDPVLPVIIQRKAPGNEMIRFKEAHLRLALDRSRLIALELRVRVDVTTALEAYLSRVKQAHNPGDGGARPFLPVGRLSDPNDGVIDFRIQYSRDPTTGRWEIRASMFEQDSDGFLQTPPPTDVATDRVEQNYWRDFFGMLIALAPLTDAIATANTTPGTIVALSMQAALPLATATSGIVRVPRITCYGGEFIMTVLDGEAMGAVLFDLEVALVISFGIGAIRLIDTDPRNPITIRYKAVGARSSTSPQLRDFVPVFDSSKGYAVNIPSTGGIRVPAPLGDILQVAGTRISRSNPANIELDLEVKADLGVVSVERTTIRIPLESGHAPTINALGVHLDIAGVIEGGGYLAIYEDGFAGAIDVSLPSIGVRIAGVLSIRDVKDPANPARKATAVLITLEIDFPVPIPLGSSGLGIYGFGGLFALHHRRTENPSDPVPALDWLRSVNGNPMDIRGWAPEIDTWAIGLGAVLGTMDAGFILNVKGMLIFEMPGPRLLFMMKANILWVRPPRQGNPEATILAVIDLDLGRRRITVALSLDYKIPPMIAIHVPVRAIFPFDDLANFALDAGSWYAPAQVTFFELFKARGYFMIRGRGIPDQGAANYDGAAATPFPLQPLGGFSIATGVSVSFIWGDKDWGLYISAGGAADFGMGFSPIVFQGKLRIWGELHLWIVSIEAHAALDVMAGQLADGPPLPDPHRPGKFIQPTRNTVRIDGEVYGRVDCFFFDVEGSVHVTLGTTPDATLAPPPLVTGVSLQSRAEALLSGVSSDRPIDGKLFDARPDDSAIADADAVPIDSIIVLSFDCIPRMEGMLAFAQPGPDGAAQPIESPLPPHPTGPTAPAVMRGDRHYTYRIRRISLDNSLTAGEVPFLWWPGVPNPGAESKCELALLTRVPNPHPSAVERSRHARSVLTQQWETICRPVAGPAPVLWTFHDAFPGASPSGWAPEGKAWPDAPGATRASPPRLRLEVAEVWRSGHPLADMNAAITPAQVIGGPVACPEGCGTRARPKPGRRVASRASTPGLAEVISAGKHFYGSLAMTGPALRHAGAQKVITLPCHARALEAPSRQPLSPARLSEHPLGQVLADLVQKAQEQDDRFDNVLAFATGEVALFRALILVSFDVMRAGSLGIRYFDASGKLLAEQPVDGQISRDISGLADLPKAWTDRSSPWRCRVLEVATLFGISGAYLSHHRIMGALLIETAPPEGSSYIQLGIFDAARHFGEGEARYFVGIIETLSRAELQRHHSESQSRQSWQDVVNGALKPMPDPPALLQMNTEYRVAIEWDYATCDANGGALSAWTVGDPQIFRFRTDAAPLASRSLTPPGATGAKDLPSRLDPWILATDPGEGERFRFCADPVRIIFSVDYLLNMYKTYGVELEARVRAASFRNVSPVSPGFPLTGAILSDLVTAPDRAPNVRPLTGTAVLKPWEAMARDVLADEPCIASSGTVVRQTMAELDLLLEPYTEYVLDIGPKDAPPDPPGQVARPLFRRAFTTSRYASAGDMCADVATADLTEYPAGNIQEILDLALAPAPLSRSQIDAALRSAGLAPLTDTPEARVEVIWADRGGVLQPRILILRTPEPLVRTRKLPVTIEPPGQPRLQREVVVMQDALHFEVVSGPGAPPMTLIAQPGLNIVIALIEEGRGKPLTLRLRQHHSAFYGEPEGTTDLEMILLRLDAAIWEVV